MLLVNLPIDTDETQKVFGSGARGVPEQPCRAGNRQWLTRWRTGMMRADAEEKSG